MKIEIENNWKSQYSVAIKMLLLGVMGIFLLVPLELIKSVIRERQNNSDAVKKEIALQWASEQTIIGPVLNIPVLAGKSATGNEPVKNVYHIMPENLAIVGLVNTEKRHRGIYKAVVYTSDITLKGEFTIPEFPSEDKTQLIGNEAYFSLGLTDNRGVKGSVSLKTNNEDIEAVPGVRDNDLFSTGITFPKILSGSEKKIPFEIKLSVSGTGEINFVPTGKLTDVKISSSWNSPGFKGNFLPAERTISNSGFTAHWVVTNLNRNFPQFWSGYSYKPASETFGIEFILQVDHYLKTMRSAKYGILFIALTFLSMMFAEMTSKKRFNIFHYLLTSLALVLFFSLLNALSEHTGFNLAYLISSVSVIALISSFLKPIVSEWRPVILISGSLIFLYAFIFVLLSLNDYAYLAGNIGLFVLLAITMAVSVRLNSKENELYSN